MAALVHNQLYSNEPHTPLHWHKQNFEGEDESTLDDNILDTQSYDMHQVQHSQRRESMASNASLVSPSQQSWHDFSYNHVTDPTYTMNNSHPPTLFSDHNPSQFTQPDAPQFANYAPQIVQWQQQNDLSPDATSSNFNTYPTEAVTIKPEAPYNNEVIPPQDQNVYGGLPVAMESEYSQYPAQASSPQWSTSSSDAVEKIPRSGQFQPPLFNHNPPHLRRDGVRKKNARFEIPEGRNLQTIDELINSTNPNNEDEIKELKQQKRLLRNRQAALDSRCRKKHHTEKLEEEKKHFLTVIDRLEEEVRNLQMSEQRWIHERQQWQQYSDNLNREKEELVRQHTLETADLRKKNNALIEEAQRFDSTAMSAQPSSTGVSAGFHEFEHLSMNSSPFDDFSFIDQPPIIEMESKPETSVTLKSKVESVSSAKTEDNNAASGLLLMLLLCGAWVASRNPAAGTAPLPRMPDDVRAASAVVLEDIYKDAGLAPQTTSQLKIQNAPSMAQAAAPRPSGKAVKSASPLSYLHQNLITPSAQQQREQAFSLSVDQYNHITSDDTYSPINQQQEPNPVPSSRRRNLSETLAAMRAKKQGPAGEVYTKSLMMDKVPADVVRDFARMMEECRRGEPLS